MWVCPQVLQAGWAVLSISIFTSEAADGYAVTQVFFHLVQGTALHPDQWCCLPVACSSDIMGAGCWIFWITSIWDWEDQNGPWHCLPPAVVGVRGGFSAAICFCLHCSLFSGKETSEEAALRVVKETKSEGEERPSRGETTKQVSISPPCTRCSFFLGTDLLC